MIQLLRCEWMKTRRRHLMLTVLLMTALAGAWAFYGNYTGETGKFMLRNGYLMFLYQLPLTNAIFFPLLATVVASRLCDLEHKGSNLKLICIFADKKRLYDAKLIYGALIVSFAVVLLWLAALVTGKYLGFSGSVPYKLYGIYLLFTLTPTLSIYVFQHTLSIIFKNQAIPFFAGILGEFIGLFSMFLPNLPILRKLFLWGYYGALQFVGLWGWSKETRYTNAYFEVANFDWTAFGILIAGTVLLYWIGKKIFSEREV